jgi:hypothetical protein
VQAVVVRGVSGIGEKERKHRKWQVGYPYNRSPIWNFE